MSSRSVHASSGTLQPRWHEYIETHPDGYRYSQFCERYRRWARKLNPSMLRQVHRAGERTFIDYSGKKPHLVDRHTGEERPVELFVAALGASSYIFAEATEAQSLPSWDLPPTGAGAPIRQDFTDMQPDQGYLCLARGPSDPRRYRPGLPRRAWSR